MNDRLAIHALWAGTFMYCVAIVALAVVGLHREPQTAESIATKLVALFGPIVSIVGLVLTRRLGKQQPPTTGPGASPGS